MLRTSNRHLHLCSYLPPEPLKLQTLRGYTETFHICTLKHHPVTRSTRPPPDAAAHWLFLRFSPRIVLSQNKLTFICSMIYAREGVSTGGFDSDNSVAPIGFLKTSSCPEIHCQCVEDTSVNPWNTAEHHCDRPLTNLFFHLRGALIQSNTCSFLPERESSPF